MIVRVAVLLAALVGAGCGVERSPRFAAPKTPEDLAFETGVDREPTARTLYAMARILAAGGRDSKARVVLSRIVREHPEFLPAYCDLAELHMRHGRVDAATATLEAALRVRPLDAVILNNLGMCRLEKRCYDEALAYFTRAAGLAPETGRYRANMAIPLALMGRYAEALSLYKQVLGPEQAHANLAVLCRANRDHGRAQQETEKAAALVRQREQAERGR